VVDRRAGPVATAEHTRPFWSLLEQKVPDPLRDVSRLRCLRRHSWLDANEAFGRKCDDEWRDFLDDRGNEMTIQQARVVRSCLGVTPPCTLLLRRDVGCAYVRLSAVAWLIAFEAERVVVADRIPAGIRVEIDATGEPDGILGQEDPLDKRPC
jgi:hypothetical protein